MGEEGGEDTAAKLYAEASRRAGAGDLTAIAAGGVLVMLEK